MYIVTLINGDALTEIHNEKEKLKSGSVVQGINTIDSFSFTLLPSNIGFNLIQDFQTLVTVFNTNTGKYEFHGRVLYSRVAMETSGLITKEVTCESFFGFLCDSVQEYVAEQNWTVAALLQHIISCHNSQVEKYKQFKIGSVDSSLDNNDNTFVGIQRKNTWDCIKEKLLDRLGGEIRFRVEENGLYIDYMKEFGETVDTEIALSKNMKAIAREHDPSSYVTRLYPYGCKLKDADGNETEQRLDISSVNGGQKYIDDEEGIEAYGVHAGFVEFDDVTTANILLTKGQNWLAENNLLQVKYSITALDLSLLGLDINSFEIYNRHPIKNHLISVEDTARIIKKTLNICEEVQSTIEVGDNFKTLTDIQNEQAGQIKEAIHIINNLQSTTNVKVEKAEQAADDARKVATNYLDFAGKHGEGLVIGALTEETLGKNIQLSGDSILFRDGKTVLGSYSADEILLGRTTSKNLLIDTSGVDIRMGTTVLASFEDNLIKLGNGSSNAKINLLGGVGEIYASKSSSNGTSMDELYMQAQRAYLCGNQAYLNASSKYYNDSQAISDSSTAMVWAGAYGSGTTGYGTLQMSTKHNPSGNQVLINGFANNDYPYIETRLIVNDAEYRFLMNEDNMILDHPTVHVTGALYVNSTAVSLNGHNHDERYYTESEINTKLNAKQNSLGFTPVQQGGGASQGTNKIYIGWDGSTHKVKCQVDATNMGAFALESWANDTFSKTDHSHSNYMASNKFASGTYVYNSTSKDVISLTVPSGYSFAVCCCQDAGVSVERVYVSGTTLKVQLSSAVTLCRINYILFN